MEKATKTVGEYSDYNEKERMKSREGSDNKDDLKLVLPTINNNYIDWKMRMEIEKLVLTDVRLPRLTDINRRKITPSKPHYHDHLMKFELDDARAVQIHAYLTDMALCMKTTSFVALRPSKRYLVLPRPKRFYYDAMLLHVPIAPSLPTSTLQRIQSILPKNRVSAFKEMVKFTADEVTILYDSVSHRLASHELLKERPHDERISLFHDLKSSSIPELTFHQLPDFHNRQLQLQSKLLLLHTMMLKVLDSTFTNIPEIIMNFGVYRKQQRDYYDINKLQESIVKDLKRAESLVTRIWYPKVINMISKKGALGKLSKENLLKFLKCATTIISCQMTLLVERTMDHYVDAISNEDTTPKLKLEAGVDVSEFFIYPRKRVIYKLYHSVIDIISSIGQDMPTMEVWFPDLPVTSPTCIYVRRNEMKLADAHSKLDEGLDLLFHPVEEHLKNNIENVYHVIMSTDHSKTLFRFISDSTRTYKELFERMDFYDGFHENCNWILDNVFFNVGRLYQARIQGIIKKQAGYFMNKIVTCILTKYECDYNRICSEFETLKARALKVPKTTSELVALGNYMEFATTKFVENKRQEISKMAEVNAKLLDFVLIGEQNIMKISNLVNWLYNIVPIFEQFTTMFEQTKNELEDRLQKTIEKLNKDLEDIGPSLSFLSNMENTKKIFSYVQSIQTYLRKLEVFEETVVWINNEETLLKFPLTTYPELDELNSVIHPFAKLIYTCNKWFKTRKNWTNGDFEALVVENVEKSVEAFYMEIFEAEKTFKLKCKQHAVDNYPRRYRGVVDDPDFNNWPAPLKLCHETLRSIKEFKPHIKIVSIMCNPALTDQHWKEMSELAQLDLTPDAGTTLQKLVDLNLESLFDQFEIISIGATKELQLQKNLKKMYSEWTSVTFVTKFLSERDCYVVDGLDDIQALLDNHFVKTLSMRGSAFVKPVKDEVKHWYDMLVRMSTAVLDWYGIQEDWLNFQMIFSSPVIVLQMSGESKLFREVDYRYRKLMKSINLDPIVIKSHQSDVQSDTLLGTLQVCLTLLQQIKHGINKYFEKKRLYFPRFFFVSNTEMLNILSQTKEPVKVQPYLNRCFEAISKVGFDKNMNIICMFSKENEKIDFIDKICTEDKQGCVEKWLIKIESQMISSLKNAFKLSSHDYNNTEWIEWLKKWPEQAVSCMSLAYWTSNLQHCLTERNSELVKQYFVDFSDQVDKVIELVRSSLSARERITLSSMVILHVHAKDVIKGLIDKSICTPHDFQWLSQLRYYYHPDHSEMSVCITNAKLNYSYEYIGNVSRLVITPLTERCNLTLIGAYNLHMNVAAEGPASTGKTESIKDLAKAIAIQCLNFNSNSQLDYKSLSQFFKGIASCGSWVCFDDFNRVELQVLSVVAQQMHSIMLAIRNNVKVLQFDSCELNLNPSCFVCITVNPGYVGRCELPDNLKVLFRTVAMMVPDFSLIGKILLMSYGFREAENLSVKVVATYKLFSEQLSTQPHYEFGLRSIKTVIQNAGDLKTKQPDVEEHLLILQALVNITFPQVLDEYDASIFCDIISDMFNCEDLPHHEFKEAHITSIKKACCIKCVQPSDNFVKKILQTYQMMTVRHGFVLVGQPFCGKTTILHVLAEAISLGISKGKSSSSIAIRKLNPKAITMQQLYGYMDRTSNEWIDGIIPKLFRELLCDNSAEKKWVVFDGPVDAEWIENINTVLDDSRKLCLNSLEVIYLTSNMSLIFEVTDLTQASPATVSRLGIIYVQENCIDWKCLVKSWLQSLPEEFSDISVELGDYFYSLVDPCQEFIENNCQTVISAGIYNSVKTMLSLVYIFMMEAFKENTVDDMKHISLWIQASLILAVTWGLAGTLDQDSREKFDAFFKELWREGITKDGESAIKTDLYIPSEGIVHDHFFHFKGKGQWKYWPDILRHIRIDEMDNVLQTLIPTVDSCKYLYFIERHIKHRLPMLLAGPPCTGKSLFIKDFMMKNLPFDKYIPALMSFTTNTSARLTQQVLLSKLVKRKQGIQGPPIGRTCIIFIDDLHMPMREDFGAQPPIELLRQFFDHGFWYDLKDLSKIQLEDILLLAAVGTATKPVSRRLLRHFHLFSVNMLSDESIIRIFTSFLYIGYRRNGFGTDVAPIITTIVTAMLDMYHSLLKTLLPTPNKPHYLFNISDMSLVISGHLLVKKDSVDSKKFFIKLWVHEMMRVFHDRLVDQSECTWFYKQLRNTVEEHFKESFDLSLDSLLGNEEEEVTEEKLRNLFFANVADGNSSDRKYEELNSIEQFHNLAINALEKYNQEHTKKLNIILFDYALVHLSRMLRMLSVPGGCGLLVGPGGSGRQSLIVLAAALSNHKTFQPNIMNDYSFEDWREDLKHILMDTGGRNKSVVFIFTEYQINRDYYLEDIDVLINSGEVPNIFNVEEIQNILELVRLDAQGGNRNLDIHPLTVLSYFKTRCKDNLHVMLCLSPGGSAFRNRLLLYPSFINFCIIDWFQDWPEDALVKLSEFYLKDVDLEEERREHIIETCKKIYTSARDNADYYFKVSGRKTFVTSEMYLNFIRLFADKSIKREKELLVAKEKYENGLGKLEFAGSQVLDIKKELEELVPLLEAAGKETEQMKDTVVAETIQVDKGSALVREDEKIANIQATAANELKTECEADLAQAIPILEEAVAALNTLKPTDITLVKSMKNPPDTVKLVMAAVCVMKDIKPDRIPDAQNPGRKKLDYWAPSKRLLGDMGFLQGLKDFDKDNISPLIMQTIRKQYIPNKDFKPHIVAKASSAAEGLCKWVIAMDMYDAVAKEVAPKKAKLEIAEQEYKETVSILEEKRDMVRQLEFRLAALTEKLKEATKTKEKLQEQVNSCSKRLLKAEKLIDGLSGDKEKWLLAVEKVDQSVITLYGDMIISAALMSYLSFCSEQLRQPQIEHWKTICNEFNIPFMEDYDFIEIMGSEVKLDTWILSGLIEDNFSMENAVIVDNTNRWPLFIDPQGKANEWLKETYKYEMETIQLIDSDYLSKLISCLENGKAVLLENVPENLNISLNPVLLKDTLIEDDNVLITLGKRTITYHKDFKLFATTKLLNPVFSPNVFSKMTVIHFVMTIAGLETQLLQTVMAKERPDLEEKRRTVNVKRTENKIAQREMEEVILNILQSTGGNIIDNEDAIQSLDEAKKTLVKLLASQRRSKSTDESVIKRYYQLYSDVSKYAAMLYYCLAELVHIDPLYQFSLPWFNKIYVTSIEAVQRAENLDDRLKDLMSHLTHSLYEGVCCCLFEKDCLIFSFILCTSILIWKNQLDRNEVMFLVKPITCNSSSGDEFCQQNTVSDWLPDEIWNSVGALDNLDAFQGFKEHFVENSNLWRQYYDDEDPLGIKLPDPWKNLSHFQKLILLRIFRADKLVPAIKVFVETHLGRDYVVSQQFDLEKSYQESSNTTPLLFIQCAGVDPMTNLIQFAEKMQYKNKLQILSLGQGQGELASTIVEKGKLEGSWVCLQNCHLGVDWLPQLETICENLKCDIHCNFRLWLTSEPTNKLPISVLQRAIKMTFEPPTGLKQNMMSIFCSEPVTDDNFFYGCPGKDRQFTRLLFGLCFFHAVILERKNFGPIGWNIPYSFNESDYKISVQQLQMYLNDSQSVPYEAILYLTGECSYGGRVSDDWDQRTLNTLLAKYINPNMIEPEKYKMLEQSDYIIPIKYEFSTYIDIVQGLPYNPPTDVFGLHSNASISQNLQSTKYLLNAVLSVQPEFIAIKQETEKFDEMHISSIVNDILKKLPETFDIDLGAKNEKLCNDNVMNIILIQEMKRFNKLLETIRTSIEDLRSTIEGLSVLTPHLESVANDILNNHCPKTWMDISYPSRKNLSSYICDLLKRVTVLKEWQKSGTPNEYWLSGFYFPQCFLTAVLQSHARNNSFSVADLTFDFEVMQIDSSCSPPICHQGVYVHGLFIEGARWDRKMRHLTEQYPKVLFDTLPLTWFKPVLKSELAVRGRYRCPIYKTTDRRGTMSTAGHSSNYIRSLLLDTDQPPSHWIKRGCALLCQKDM